MRVLKRFIDHKNGAGSIRIQCDVADDVYHLYNLISVGDTVTAGTVRNVSKESKTGSVDKSRVRIQLTVVVERVDFDEEQCSLRICGKNVRENEHVKLGQYHTLDLEIGHPFTVEKDCWDQIYLDTLKEASNPSAKADIAAVVLQEGLAHVCLITATLTVTRARIERKMPKKKTGDRGFEKALAHFFADIYDAVLKHVNFDVVKAILIGSPGFLKEDLLQYMMERATRQGETAFLKQRSKIVTSHASSGYKKAIDDLLGNPDLRTQLLDIRAADEVKALQTFYDTLSRDQDRAVYGFQQVLHADDNLAIAELLITDKLFKAADIHARRRYVALTESVKANGGRVFVFSSMHVSGEQLASYTGVAATLRFPLPEEEAPSSDSPPVNNKGKASGVPRVKANFDSDSDVD